MTAAGVLALVGPTGSGKSATAMAVARSVGAEIVAVDAFTVYRGMDIGTAKPSADDRGEIPHHLIDVLDPAEDCTAQWFQRHARQAIAHVHARGRLPLLVGGSGLYLRAVVDDLAFPPTDAGIRAALHERWSADPAGAYAALGDVDPAAAGRIDPLNLRRVVRALEVLEITGRPFSDWRRDWESYRSVYPRFAVVGIDMSRERLRERLDSRVEAMLAAGWLAECSQLLTRPLSITARQAIGYAELFAHLEGRCDLNEAVERAKIRTRQYAMRQLRWFRADPRVQWVPPEHATELLIGSAG